MSRQPMNGADAAWLHMDRPTNPMVVNSVMWFDEPVDFDRYRDVVRRRLVDAFPRFRQRIVEPRAGLGIPDWEDDPDFDLDRHIHHIALPGPGDRTALQELVGHLISAPLDRGKPLWAMYVIDGYGAGMAQVTRIHHCIADGIALGRVLLSLTDERPDAGIARPVRPHVAVSAARLAGTIAHEALKIATHPAAELPDLLAGAVRDADALGKLVLTPRDGDNPFRAQLHGRQRVSFTDEISLASVAAIGRRTQTTVNDVLVAAVTAALRRTIAEHGYSVDQLRAMVPFNLRPLDKPLPRELGNRFGLVYLQLPVGIRGPRKRLDEVHRQMDAIKHSPEGAVAYGLLSVIGLTPPQIERRLVDLFASKCSLVLTNVPGPRQPVYLAGARVAGVIPWVPAGGSIGLGISIFSYDGRVAVGVRADTAALPDPDALVAGIERELARMAPLGASRCCGT
ncbi:MAG TPA: wax ester/triacylglycerol synthase family O-acyltransferase [Gaiellales bacterium]|nr:wax ester/triacylglycerol synthase family O-acyltransferase [Gaiellales bacterium]